MNINTLKKLIRVFHLKYMKRKPDFDNGVVFNRIMKTAKNFVYFETVDIGIFLSPKNFSSVRIS